MTNTNNELSVTELDAIVGGGQCGGGINWGHVGGVINKVNAGVGAAMAGGVTALFLTGYGAGALAIDAM